MSTRSNRPGRLRRAFSTTSSRFVVVVVRHLVMDGVDLGAMALTPEPATLALAALGAVGILLRRRRH